MKQTLFATYLNIQQDEANHRENHGKIWSNYDMQLLRVEINAGNLSSLQIAKELKRSVNSICLKAKTLNLLTFDAASCCYYVAREMNNPCAEVNISDTQPCTLENTMSTPIITTQTIVFGAVIEKTCPDSLMELLVRIKNKQTELSNLDAGMNAYVIKQLQELALAKAAVLAELDKRA